jgi:hypothetical protein
MTASRALPLAVLGGLVASLLFVAGMTGSTGGAILDLMASLPLFAVGFRLGTRPLLGAGLVATVAVTAVNAGAPEAGLGFAAMIAVPVIVLVRVALSLSPGRSAGMLVLALTGLGLAAFSLDFLAALSKDGGLQGVMTAALKEIAQRLSEQLPEAPPLRPETLEWFGFWLPGAMVAALMLVWAGNGILAQGVLARFGGGLDPAPSMANIILPRMVSIGFVAALLAAIAESGEIAFVGVNLAEILAVPLLFGGLGLIHAAVSGSAERAVVLTVLYAVFIGVAIPFIVALGVIEQWVGLRQRFAPAPRRGEE